MKKITSETSHHAKFLMESEGNALYPEGCSYLIRELIKNQNQIIDILSNKKIKGRETRAGKMNLN